MKKYFFILLLPLLFSCKPQKETESSITSIDIKSFKQLELEQIINSIECIPLEMSDESILPSIGVIRCSDKGYFYNAGSPQSIVYYFDFDGKFKSTIGKLGKGPGEFSFYSDFSITHNEVIFADRPKTSILRYDFSGNYLETTLVDIDGTGSLIRHPENGNFYLYTPNANHLITIADPSSGEILNSLFPNPGKGGATYWAFNKTLDNRLLFHDPLDMQLSVYELTDTLTLKYEFDCGMNFKGYSRTDMSRRQRMMEEQEFWFIRVLLENTDWLYICLSSQHNIQPVKADFHHFIYT